MGLYNYVNKFEFKCPYCGEDLSEDFQSKEATIVGKSGKEYYLNLSMQKLDPSDFKYIEVTNHCKKCDIFFVGKIENGQLTLSCEK